jgi:hypothetical protein
VFTAHGAFPSEQIAQDMPANAYFSQAKVMIQRALGSSVPAVRRVTASAAARAKKPKSSNKGPVSSRPPVTTPSWSATAVGRVQFSINPGSNDTVATTVDIAVVKPSTTFASTVVTEFSVNGKIVDANVAHQYIGGVLTIAVKGSTLAGQWRHFVVTFLPTPAKPTAARVKLEWSDDEGQKAHRIDTDHATFVIQHDGASLSSMLDDNGADWIGYHAAPDDKATGAKSIFRGIPNFPFPEGHFHPGFTSSHTEILSEGPLRTVIRSESGDGKWAYESTIYPSHMKQVVLKADRAFWWLYEGTPGGETEDRYCRPFQVARSGNAESPSQTAWEMTSAGLSWAAFRVPGLGTPYGRSLFVGRAGTGLQSSYYLASDSGSPIAAGQRGAMTVFGFGRSGMNATIAPTELPATFVVGLAEPTDARDLERQVLTALTKWTTSVQPFESGPKS